IEVRQGPCGQEIAGVDLLCGVLYPHRMHRTPRTGFRQCYAEEGRLLVVALDQMNPATDFRQQNGGDDSWKTAARTEIDPDRRRRIEPEQLRAVTDMARPELFQCGRCNQIDLRRPFSDQAGEMLQPF